MKKKLTFELEGEVFINPRYYAYLRSLQVDIVESNDGHYLNVRNYDTFATLTDLFEIPDDFVITLESYANRKEFVFMEHTEDFQHILIQDIYCSVNGFAGVGIYAIPSEDFLNNSPLAGLLESYIIEPMSLIRNTNKVVFEYTGRVQTVIHGKDTVGISCLKRDMIKDEMIKAIFRERQEIVLN